MDGVIYNVLQKNKSLNNFIIKIIQLCYIRMHILHTLYSKLYTLCCKPILKLLGKDTTYLK
jgi:hypothetical protein